MSSTKKTPFFSEEAPSNGLSSQSQVTQHQQFPIRSQSQSNSHSTYPWSAHTPPFRQSPSPFLRSSHALSTTATDAGELFLFGGYVHNSKSPSNDLYVISTRDFSTTLLQTRGDVPNPRCAHGVVLTSTILLIWGGMHRQNQGYDDSLYLLDLGTSDLLTSRPAPANQYFFHSSIAGVDPRRG